MPDREERHLLSEDLGSGEPVSRASAQRKKAGQDFDRVRMCFKIHYQKMVYFR